MMKSDILNIIRELYPFAYSVVSPENDRALSIFREYLDFNVVEFSNGLECNGWIVPKHTEVRCANIYKNGTRIYDGLSHPLGVGVSSPSFKGHISLVNLKSHLFYSEVDPDAIPYHWANLYRPVARDWAFCVPKKFFDSLTDGDYMVDLETVDKVGTMKVLDFILPGKSKETILLNGHNCHPWQANDDLSGCAVGIAVMRALQSRPKLRYTYRLVIAPELIGTVHWLASLGDASTDLIGAIMLKAVGNASPLKLQHSFLGISQLDRAASCVLSELNPDYVSGAFRTIYGNDETVFDSPGYEIPTISLTRFPFSEYHTSLDTPDRVCVNALNETYDAVLGILDAQESSQTLRFAVKGLVALSHQRYQLYRPAAAPGIDKTTYTDKNRRWNLLMNCLPRELDGEASAIDLAYKYGLPVHEVCAYLDAWQEKSLAIPVERGRV
jgi:aminopeptidase-like protein